MSSFHEPVDHIALSESKLEALNETNMEPSPRKGHEILCVKFESLLQSQNSSTPASFREMVATWKDKNKSANITGEICLRNPFEVSIVPSEKMGEMGGEEGLGGGWYGPQTILLGSKLEPILTQNARILIPNPPSSDLTSSTQPNQPYLHTCCRRRTTSSLKPSRAQSKQFVNCGTASRKTRGC